MSTAVALRISKVFELAAHPGTTDNEALAAVRRAKAILDGAGMGFHNLTFSKVANVADGGGNPTVSAMMRKISSLEKALANLTQENERLSQRVVELEQNERRLLEENLRVTHEARAEEETMSDEAQTDTVTEQVSYRAEDEAKAAAPEQPETTALDEAEPAPEAEMVSSEAAAEPVSDAVDPAQAEAPVRTKRRYNYNPEARQNRFVFAEHPEVYERTIALYFAGVGKGDIVKLLVKEFPDQRTPNSTQVCSVTANGKPAPFLNARVRDSGPIDWPEAWLIGSTLFSKQRSWLGPTLAALGIPGGKNPRKGLAYDLNNYVTEAAVDKLREDYRFHVANND